MCRGPAIWSERSPLPPPDGGNRPTPGRSGSGIHRRAHAGTGLTRWTRSECNASLATGASSTIWADEPPGSECPPSACLFAGVGRAPPKRSRRPLTARNPQSLGRSGRLRRKQIYTSQAGKSAGRRSTGTGERHFWTGLEPRRRVEPWPRTEGRVPAPGRSGTAKTPGAAVRPGSTAAPRGKAAFNRGIGPGPRWSSECPLPGWRS